ncbi:MAG: hypothetical protein E5V85_06755 [Mesorhizobium sp.]|nr:MAG: hypothetical protein E5V85_06755 [Mesorhizobium sp.]
MRSALLQFVDRHDLEAALLAAPMLEQPAWKHCRRGSSATPTQEHRQNAYKIPISFLPAPSRTFMAAGSIFRSEKEVFTAVVTKMTCARMQFWSCLRPGGKTRAKARNATMDLIVLGIGILFFAVSLAYVKACDRI